MSLFQFDDYKLFVNHWIANLSGKKRGALQRISHALNIHPTLVSHIFRGDKNLSLEQASLLCRYLALSHLETDYFILLVQKAKAGSHELRSILDRQLQEVRTRASDLVNRVIHEQELTESDKTVFYSAWYYSGIRLLTSVPGLNSARAIHERLQLPLSLVQDTLDFLTRTGLCISDGKRYTLGPSLTHLESGSKQVTRHHVNWRLKVIEQHPLLDAADLIFTGPLSISRADAEQFRERLVQLVQELGGLAKSSPGEELRCFNLDWVRIRK